MTIALEYLCAIKFKFFGYIRYLHNMSPKDISSNVGESKLNILGTELI